MENIFLVVVLATAAFGQICFAQDKTMPASQLLPSYYDIKNALVSGNANVASLKSMAFVQSIKSSDQGLVYKFSSDALIVDAVHISTERNIQRQRKYFAALSVKMHALAKAIRLSTQPIYYTYCPMKKSYWLSNEDVVQNPYFGSAMLTCGKVEEVFK